MGAPDLLFCQISLHHCCQGVVGVNICRRSQLFGLKSIEVEVVVADVDMDVDEEVG